MAKICLEIDKCSQCPFHYTVPVDTGDSWDHMEDYMCSKGNKKIAGAVEWPSEIPVVPEWCPIKLDQEGDIL